MTGRMTSADTVCCTSNEEFGGRSLKHPFLHFSHSLSESISHASFRCSSRREEPSDMTLNVDFTPCHSCKLINLDLTSGFHQPLCHEWQVHACSWHSCGWRVGAARAAGGRCTGHHRPTAGSECARETRVRVRGQAPTGECAGPRSLRRWVRSLLAAAWPSPHSSRAGAKST